VRSPNSPYRALRLGSIWEFDDGVRVSNAPVVPLGLVVDLSYERSGISSEAAESGRGGETGCGV